MQPRIVDLTVSRRSLAFRDPLGMLWLESTQRAKIGLGFVTNFASVLERLDAAHAAPFECCCSTLCVG